MATQVRSGRADAAAERVVLPSPPAMPEREGAGATLMTAIPMLGSVAAIVLVATMSRATGGRSLIAGGLFLLSAVGFVFVQLDRQRGQRRRQLRSARAAYLHRLGDARAEVRAAATVERDTLEREHPPPEALAALIARRPPGWREAGALTVRWGTATGTLATQIEMPQGSPNADPVAVAAAERLAAVHRVQPDLPAVLDLGVLRRIAVHGPGHRSRAWARALVCSAAARHPPSRLLVAAVVDDQATAEWDWLKWLPHARSPVVADAVGPRRLVARSTAALRTLVHGDAGVPETPGVGPHLLVVVDVSDPGAGTETVVDAGVPTRSGLTEVALGAAPDGAADLDVTLSDRRDPDAGVPARLDRDGTGRPGRGDQLDRADAEACARRLAPRHGRETAADHGHGFTDLLGIGHPSHLDVAACWRRRQGPERLRVPIGVADDGSALALDLKESAEDGMGPHGLVVGATGSGKSELLRTLVLGLALTHSTEQLNLVLVDFKGGATFAGLADLPQVSAVITNLADDLALVDRMQDALAGELVRRQELLRGAGDLSSVRELEAARDAGADLPPLPSLLIVIDEFSELLAVRPDLLDLFVAVGRLGRSLGVHLLLASQRLEEGRLRGLDAHLSYRVGLRTFSAAESRAVLGVPDAASLPSVPGVGYLRHGPDRLHRFRAAHVSGPVPIEEPVRRGAGDPVVHILPFTAAEVAPVDRDGREPWGHARRASAPAPAPEGRGRPTRSLLDAAVERIRGEGGPAHRVWLPPLDLPDPLDRLCPDLAEVDGLGLVSPAWRRRGPLTFPVGAVDRPREQRRDPLVLSLTGAGGHVAVVGGPRSGKSTLLRTTIAGLALTSTPREAQVYVLDMGGSLGGLAGLPHVAAIAGRDEPEVVRRAVAEAAGLVHRREAWFRDQGLDGVDDWRARRASGGPDDGRGDVFLVIDDWSAWQEEHGELEATVLSLARSGLRVGVHLVLSTGRWSELRAPLRDLLGTRLELRLADPLDSEIDRRRAAAVPVDRPGRCLTGERQHALTALPRIDGDAGPDTAGDGLADLVRRVAGAWSGPPAAPLALLPQRVPLGSVRDRAGDPDHRSGGAGDGQLLLGLGEHDLAPVGLDPAAYPHLLVLGEGGSGRTTVLRTVAAEVARVHAPAAARIVAVDYRRTLLGEVPGTHLLDHLAGPAQAVPALAELAAHLRSRLPGPGVTPAELRSRDWWHGAEVFVLVDDHDLVATSGSSPLAPLLPLLPQAGDVGLHLVVTRRTGGAGRALHEPTLQALRELAQPTLLLSGDPDDGPLVGRLAPERLPPGRGRLVIRDRALLLQVAWSEPAG